MIQWSIYINYDDVYTQGIINQSHVCGKPNNSVFAVKTFNGLYVGVGPVWL